MEPKNRRKLTSRYWVWNLDNPRDGVIQTIVHRRAPRVTDLREYLMWVEFAASFVYAAMGYG